MATAAQLAANHANSQRSTGPRTAKGRARSAMNAVKHGLHSKRVKVLREDSIAFENRHIKWMAQADVQDDREEFLTYLNVSQALDCDRIFRANEQWIEDLVEESEAKEAEEVYKLGKRLFFDRYGHIELYGIIRTFDGRTTTSPNDEPVPVDDPAKLVAQLEKTAGGCRWLREEWLELREQLEAGRYWLGYHRIKAVRLLGRQPINAIVDERVAEIFMASYVIKRFGENGAFSELTSDLTELDISDFTGHVKEQWPQLARITTKEQGREILLDLVDRNIERVEEILAVHVQKAEKQDRKVVTKLSADQTKEGLRLLDYKKRCENAFLRGNSACKNYKKGWGREEERGRRNEDGGRRMEDGGSSWRQAAKDKVNLSWAYGAYPWRETGAEAGEGAATDGGAQAGGEIVVGDGVVVGSGVDAGDASASEQPPAAACGGDLPARGVGALEVDRLSAAAGKSGTSPTEGNGASENEANFHETVIIAELVEISHVTVNSGVDLGLDNTERSQFPESTVGRDDGTEGAPHPSPLPASGVRVSLVVDAETPQLIESSEKVEGALHAGPLPTGGTTNPICPRRTDPQRADESTCRGAKSKARNKKRSRRERAERERERRYAAALKERDPKLAEELDRVEWLLPNSVKVLREHYGGAQ